MFAIQTHYPVRQCKYCIGLDIRSSHRNIRRIERNFATILIQNIRRGSASHTVLKNTSELLLLVRLKVLQEAVFDLRALLPPGVAVVDVLSGVKILMLICVGKFAGTLLEAPRMTSCSHSVWCRGFFGGQGLTLAGLDWTCDSGLGRGSSWLKRTSLESGCHYGHCGLCEYYEPRYLTSRNRFARTRGHSVDTMLSTVPVWSLTMPIWTMAPLVWCYCLT